jgi:hypothetical protein
VWHKFLLTDKFDQSAVAIQSGWHPELPRRNEMKRKIATPKYGTKAYNEEAFTPTLTPEQAALKEFIANNPAGKDAYSLHGAVHQTAGALSMVISLRNAMRAMDASEDYQSIYDLQILQFDHITSARD